MIDPKNLSDKQRKALLAIGVAGELGTVDLATMINCAPGGIATLTRSLHERGLVRCNRNSKLRGANMWRWSLSDLGCDVVRQIETSP